MAVGMTGRVLADRYRTIRRLGSGGMATVWLAEDERLRRQVAVKRLHGDVSDDDVVRRFQREARVGASLNHPNVVAVYDIAADDEGVLIVMEYVEGRTLRDAILDGPLPPERALPILRGVAAALDHAHEHGVLHRDVKPANVLLRGDGAAKFADLGTAAYMAPERLEGEPGDVAADVYALAAVAFEMLTGRKPIEGTTPLEVAQRVVNQPVPDLRDFVPDAPAAAAAVLSRGLAKDPAARPPSAGGLVRELERAFEAEKTAPTQPAVAVDAPIGPQQQPPRRRRPSSPILAALGLVAAVALIAISASGGGDHAAKHRTAARPKPAHRAQKKRSAPAPTRAATPTTAPAQTPTQTVNAFYQHAARHDYAAAWAMLTEGGRAELGSESSFAAGQSTLRSISFPVLRTTSQTGDAATVELQSSAIHANRTDHVCGTVGLVRAGGAWLLDAFHLDTCTPARLYPGGRKPGKFPKSPKPGRARGARGAEGGD